jgi:aryl-alcohol dehydrogenase-like predicted oxidoreductase
VRSGWNFERTEGAKLEALARVRDILASDGRTVAQGALCWLLARSSVFIPIPGIRTVAQAKQNAGALEFGPLKAAQLDEIDAALSRAP